MCGASYEAVQEEEETHHEKEPPDGEEERLDHKEERPRIWRSQIPQESLETAGSVLTDVPLKLHQSRTKSEVVFCTNKNLSNEFGLLLQMWKNKEAP